MLFTVAGDVRREDVVELPLGTPLRALVEDAGGGVVGGRAMKAIVPGSSTTALVDSELDVPLDFEDMASVGSALGSGGFAVYDESACIVQVAHLYSRFLWVESCGQCPRASSAPARSPRTWSGSRTARAARATST